MRSRLLQADAARCHRYQVVCVSEPCFGASERPRRGPAWRNARATAIRGCCPLALVRPLPPQRISQSQACGRLHGDIDLRGGLCAALASVPAPGCLPLPRGGASAASAATSHSSALSSFASLSARSPASVHPRGRGVSFVRSCRRIRIPRSRACSIVPCQRREKTCKVLALAAALGGTRQLARGTTMRTHHAANAIAAARAAPPTFELCACIA